MAKSVLGTVRPILVIFQDDILVKEKTMSEQTVEIRPLTKIIINGDKCGSECSQKKEGKSCDDCDNDVVIKKLKQALAHVKEHLNAASY